MGLRVGSLVVAVRDTAVCEFGEPGVCYEVYELFGRPGWSILSRGGIHDGFSPGEVQRFLHDTGQVVPEVAGYEFADVPKLMRDFHAGLFGAAFARVRTAPEGWA